MTKNVSTLLLIDGNSLFHRAYHAIPLLTDRSGEVANAVFGFSNMLLKAIGEVKPDYVACAFDTKAPTFRHIEFEKYKAQRVAPPPDLYPQLPKVKKVLDAFGIKYFEKEGYEADDLIGTITSRFAGPAARFPRPTSSLRTNVDIESKMSSDAAGARRGSPTRVTRKLTVNVIILSSDRDVLQLVDGNIKVQTPGWNLKDTSLFGAKEVKEKYGLEPHQMVDYKSLTGDPSDNVPGIAGVGPKTASSLLQKFHTLENIFKHLDNDPVSLGNLAEKLKAGRDIALAAKKLVELERNVDMQFTIDDLRFRPDWEKVREEYQRLGFKSIVAKIPGGDVTKVTTAEGESRLKGRKELDEPNDKKSQDQLELI